MLNAQLALREHGLQSSMNGKGNCHDNAYTPAAVIQHWEAKAPQSTNAKQPKRAIGAAIIRDKSSGAPALVVPGQAK